MNGISKKITIIGVGKLGGALALALSRNGFQIENLFVKSRKTAELIAAQIPNSPKIFGNEEYSQIASDTVLIATPDSEIEYVADKLSAELRNQLVLLHTSGSLSSEILKKSKSWHTGSIHPVVSISDAIAGSEKFSGVYFGVEGDPIAIAAARDIAEKLNGKFFAINAESKALYHASAVMACGHLVALIDAANELLANSGKNGGNGGNILMPLIKSTIENLENQNTSQALTGTFARLDRQTFFRHLKAMKENVSDELIELYLELGLRSLNLVKANDSNSKNLEEMRKEILLAKRNLKC